MTFCRTPTRTRGTRSPTSARSARRSRRPSPPLADADRSLVTIVFLSLASAALFGGMTVAVRLGLRDLSDAGGAALATILPALAVVLIAAAFRHDFHHAWPFLLAGLLAPGG